MGIDGSVLALNRQVGGALGISRSSKIVGDVGDLSLSLIGGRSSLAP
jgi:hypothetical protein